METANPSSLLVTEAEENGVPALGGTDSGGMGHQMELSDDFQSPLERLIAQSTSEQRGDSFSVGSTQHLENPLATDTELRRFRGLWSPVSEPQTPPRPKASLVTLAASICCLLQAGFVWASFLSPSWLETRLFVSIDLPSIKVETPHSQLLHTTTLGSLLGNLLGADQNWAAVGLVMTSLVLPCLCAVTGIVWIVEDRKQHDDTTLSTGRRHPDQQKTWWNPRILMEYSARIGFSIFFIFCILTIGSSPLEIEYQSTKFIVVNQFEGGLVAYTLGMMFALVVLALLRFDRTSTEALHESTQRNSPSQEFSWEVHSNELFTGIKQRPSLKTQLDNSDQELAAPLLENDHNATESPSSETNPAGEAQTESDGLPFWKRVILFELALVATIFWVPALFLPLFELKYGGFVSEFMPDVSLGFRFFDLPIELWKRGISAGTNPLMMITLENIFILLVCVGPLVANLAAIGTWILEGQASLFCRRLLWILQPFLGTFVFGIALYFAIPAFETVTESAIQQFGSGICTTFESVVGDVCFTILGKPSVGLWFLLAESLALELFVALTIIW